MFSIVCDARKGHSLGIFTLALVDRKLTKKQWWTSDDESIILRYKKKSAAQFCARRLKRNNAHVVPTEEAVRTIKEQANSIVYAHADDDPSWDAHKESWR